MSYDKTKTDPALGQKVHEHLVSIGVETPIYANGLSRREKIDKIESHFDEIVSTLGLDLKDDSLIETPKRVAKMYVNEIMGGRYRTMPDPNSFPNYIENGYEGMLVVRSELKSLCSHHHQPVTGIAYIGIIAGDKLLGLSKYTRIAQWCATRGTLQEELNVMIADEIQRQCETEHVGVYIQATHGCCENRGIKAHSSLTQTTVLRGGFKNADLKKEFFDNITQQQMVSPR